MLIGSHVSLGGLKQFLGSVEEAISYDANALMVYTGPPQNTIRNSLSKMKITEAKTLMKEHLIDPNHVIIHAPYIVNLANPSKEKRQFSIDFLTEEVKRTAAMGSKIIVLHPGAHLNQGVEIGIKLISEGINQIIENTFDLNVVIALEGMAGKGTEIGRNFWELASLIQTIHSKNRVGICLDTCHLNDAGYDILHHFDEVMMEFDQIVGKSYLKVFHINDSKNERDTHKDRHENIGFGTIGFDALNYIVNHPSLEHIIKILETPYVRSFLLDNKSYPPYKHEIMMLKTQTFNDSLISDVIKEYEYEVNK
ncbi:MAG: deoxyribonuclease IV [Firmicutes bacterium]|nr:deoxyribonuclease IV [Bacillota bacterium]